MSLTVPSTFDIAVIASSLAPAASVVEVGEIEAVVGGERNPAKFDAALGREHVPRNDVGVVLHLGEHDDIARPQVGAAPRIRDEVDGLGGVAGEDELGDVAGADELRDRTPGRLERAVAASAIG